MIEEGTTAEIEVNSAKAVMAGRSKGESPTNGKRIKIIPESSEEGGVSMPDHPSITTHLNVGTVENMAIMNRSAGKRRVTQCQLADSSQITLLTPTTMIVAECP